jgi:hypothetical protein
VIEVQFDGSGSYLASCALDGTLVVYGLALQSFIHRLELDDIPSSMRWVYAVSGYSSIVVGFTSGNLCQITFKQDNVWLFFARRNMALICISDTSQFQLINLSDVILVELSARLVREVMSWSLLLAVRSRYGVMMIPKVPIYLSPRAVPDLSPFVSV